MPLSPSGIWLSMRNLRIVSLYSLATWGCSLPILRVIYWWASYSGHLGIMSLAPSAWIPLLNSSNLAGYSYRTHTLTLSFHSQVRLFGMRLMYMLHKAYKLEYLYLNNSTHLSYPMLWEFSRLLIHVEIKQKKFSHLGIFHILSQRIMQ